MTSVLAWGPCAGSGLVQESEATAPLPSVPPPLHPAYPNTAIYAQGNSEPSLSPPYIPGLATPVITIITILPL